MQRVSLIWQLLHHSTWTIPCQATYAKAQKAKIRTSTWMRKSRMKRPVDALRRGGCGWKCSYLKARGSVFVFVVIALRHRLAAEQYHQVSFVLLMGRSLAANSDV